MLTDNIASLCSIETYNFAFRNHHNSKFRFGETLVKDYSQLRQTLIDVFNIPDETLSTNGLDSMRKIVLVGHAFSSELRSLDALHLPVESFPHIIGIVETHYLSIFDLP